MSCTSATTLSSISTASVHGWWRVEREQWFSFFSPPTGWVISRYVAPIWGPDNFRARKTLQSKRPRFRDFLDGIFQKLVHVLKDSFCPESLHSQLARRSALGARPVATAESDVCMRRLKMGTDVEFWLPATQDGTGAGIFAITCDCLMKN